MNLSHTKCSYMKLCPRKFKFRYVDGLIPRKKDTKLLKGKVVHEAFERYFGGEDLKGLLAFILDTFNKAISVCTPEEEEDLILAKYTAYGMIENYPFEDMKFESLKPEEKFNVRIPGMYVKYRGVVDGLARMNNCWWIREVKTTGSSFNASERKASVSSQATGYVWAMQEQEHIDIVGVVYDFITESRLRKRVSDTATTFGERILEDYRSHKINEETGKQGASRLYRRYWTYRSKYHLSEFIGDLRETVKAMRNALNKNEFPRNTESCYFYNKECPYLRICWMPKLDKEMLNVYYERRGEE